MSHLVFAPTESAPMAREPKRVGGIIFNIQRFSVQDGAGIRTTIFAKGCPLRCPWCSNPESQNSFKEVGHVDSLCNHCGLCIEVCDKKAITLAEPKGVYIDRKLCNNCGECVSVCTENALKTFGDDIPIEEIVAEIDKDALFYRNSGGGITVSGGEPLSQPELVSAIFKRCQELRLHTTLDTTGFATPDALDMVLEYADHVLFDLKIMDSQAHLDIIKVPLEPILRNIRTIVKRGTPSLTVRVPLIPEITDTEQNISSIAQFVKELDSKLPVNILPYHRLGMSKYKMLDKEYELPDLKPQSDEKLASIRQQFLSRGLSCEIIR